MLRIIKIQLITIRELNKDRTGQTKFLPDSFTNSQCRIFVGSFTMYHIFPLCSLMGTVHLHMHLHLSVILSNEEFTTAIDIGHTDLARWFELLFSRFWFFYAILLRHYQTGIFCACAIRSEATITQFTVQLIDDFFSAFLNGCVQISAQRTQFIVAFLKRIGQFIKADRPVRSLSDRFGIQALVIGITDQICLMLDPLQRLQKFKCILTGSPVIRPEDNLAVVKILRP